MEDELERLRQENHRLKGGAYVSFDGPPGQPVIDDLRDAVKAAQAKVAWAEAQVDAARAALTAAETALTNYQES